MISLLFQSAESRYTPWVREHNRCLLRSAWALTGSQAIAEDAVQECLANAWQQRQENAGGCNNTGWSDHAVKVTVA